MGLMDRLAAALSARRAELTARSAPPSPPAPPPPAAAAASASANATPMPDAEAVAEQARRDGNAALQAGDFATALAHYDRMLQAAPDLPAGHVNRGFALMHLGRMADAEAALRRAQVLEPSSHETAYFLGNCLADQGRLGEASDQYRRAVALHAGFAHGWLSLGHVLEPLGQLDEAQKALRQAASLQADLVDAWQGLARVALARKDFEVSLDAARHWVALTPQAPYAHGVLADALRSLRRPAEALAAAEAAVRLQPQDPRILLARGSALVASQRYADALPDLQAAVQGLPDASDASVMLAAALTGTERHDEARALIDAHLQRHPDDADALHNRAYALMNQLEFEAAADWLQDVVQRRPDDATLQFDLAVALLTLGRWREGWRRYEWRLPAAQRDLGRTAPPAPGWPRWRAGDPVEGRTVLVTAEQGLGDTIHFFRYVPEVLARGAKVLVQMPARLHSLFPDLGPGCRLVAAAPAPHEADLQCPLLSLPHVLGLDDPLPMAGPYIAARADRREHWRQRLGHHDALRVGIVWAGNPGHPDDRRRSMPLEAMRRAAQGAPGVFFCSLQMELRDSDEAARAAWPELMWIGNEQTDMADTAALIEQLDAVVSVDTSVAHVCGALGRPLWLLLPYCPDWRWNLKQDRSAWYPSARLCRQPAPGQWEPVLERVMADLAALAASRSAAPT